MTSQILHLPPRLARRAGAGPVAIQALPYLVPQRRHHDLPAGAARPAQDPVQRSNEPVTSTPFQPPKRGRALVCSSSKSRAKASGGRSSTFSPRAPAGGQRLRPGPGRPGEQARWRGCHGQQGRPHVHFPVRRYGRYGDTATRALVAPAARLRAGPDGGQRPPHRRPRPRCRSTASTPTPLVAPGRPWAAESPACRWSCTCMRSSRRASPSGCAPRRSGSPTRRCPSARPGRPPAGAGKNRVTIIQNGVDPVALAPTGGPGRPAGAGG